MIILSKSTLRDCGYPDAIDPLYKWYAIAKNADWQNLAEVRQEFPHADPIGDCTCFNIGGNKYRLIVQINYTKQKIFIKHILTHSEYNKGTWKDDC